jgi:hypothetical protein
MEERQRRLVFTLAHSPTFVRVRHPHELLAVPSGTEALSLENAEVRDDDLRSLSAFPRLRCLDLDGTAISDAALAWVACNSYLEELWLESTGITDAGLAYLHSLPRLAFVSLAYTEVTESGVAALRAAMPNAEVSAP